MALAIIGRVPPARPILLVATVLGAALLGGGFVHGWSHDEETMVTLRAAPSTVTAADPPAVASSAGAVAALAAPAPARASAPRPAPETLAAQVDRLARSPDPVDAFAAYKLVTACLWARDHEAWMDHHVAPGDRGLLPTTATACGDIASDQIQSRLRWLERAALAGVHHAATEMAREGPDGLGLAPGQDLAAPQNAAFAERLAAAYDAGVHTCDPESIEKRETAYEDGSGVAPDRARALAYWVAYVDCRKRLARALRAAPDPASGSVSGSASGLSSDPAPGESDGSVVTQRMGSTLTPDQIATAVAAGAQMARDAQPLAGDF